MGLFKTKQFMITGEKIDSSQMKNCSYISQVVSSENLDKTVSKYSELLKNSAPNAVDRTKKLVKFVSENTREESSKKASETFEWMMQSEEAQHGISSFMQKKQPNWKEFHSKL